MHPFIHRTAALLFSNLSFGNLLPGIRLSGTLFFAALLMGMLSAGAAWAIDPSKGLNAASVIDFPTALDQNTTHTIHGTVELWDLGEPDLRMVNLRYGFQIGQLQLLADTFWQTDPKEYSHSEVKGKLRVLSLDEYGTYAAFGLVARYVDKKEKEPAVIDDRRYSLFAVVSAEFFPIAKWDAMLANLYVDNRFASIGVKFPIYDFIRVIGEADYHHGLDEELEGLTDKQKERWQSKIGFELEGDQNFYVQLFYSSASEHARLQIGTGF